MVKHTARAEPADKPLTAKALNAFFDAVAAGVEKAGFSEHTVQDTLGNVANNMLPISDPHPAHPVGYVLTASRKGAETDRSRDHKTLPETLDELKQRIATTTVSFDEEPSAGDARKIYDAIMSKAYRAAEMAMGQSAAR